MNVLIFGPQGSGKGTQAKLLSESYHLAHIEVGQSLRNVIRSQSPLGKRIDEIVNAKKELVPDALISQVIETEIAAVPSDTGVIIDGAPRRMSQVDAIERILVASGRTVDAAIYLNVIEDESIRRIALRWFCGSCLRKVTMTENDDPKHLSCPSCGGALRQRSDDTPDGVRKRLSIFHSETMPVIEYYRSRGILLEVDGERPIQGVFAAIGEALEKKQRIV